MTRMSGDIASTPAIATARFSPPESRNGGRSARWGAPTVASAVATRSSTSAAGRPMFSGPNATSSCTVAMNSWSSGSWNT